MEDNILTMGIVIVSFNGLHDTIECIQSIKNSDHDNFKITIFIIENGNGHESISLDKLKEGLGSCLSNNSDNSYIYLCKSIIIKVFVTPHNGGFGYGNNYGIRYFKDNPCDIVTLLNNDTVVDKYFFHFVERSNLIEHRSEKIAMGVTSVNYFDHSLIDSNGYGFYDFWTGRSSHKKHYRTTYIPGSCILMNNVKMIPLFDERFFLYCEDVDYTLSLKKSRFDIQYDPNIKIFHKVSASSMKNPQIDRIKLHSMKYLSRKYGTRIQKLTFKISRTLYYLFKRNYFLLVELWK